MPLARHDRLNRSIIELANVSTHMPLARHDSACVYYSSIVEQFLLTCLLRGMTRALRLHCQLKVVSTHMPLARHDNVFKLFSDAWFVSTHMPLARHDCALPIFPREPMFLLTCLLRGMTGLLMSRIYPLKVSTHMPLARHDGGPVKHTPRLRRFLLTCLLRGMTRLEAQLDLYGLVSTHMPLARHDVLCLSYWRQPARFYSHASCEA